MDLLLMFLYSEKVCENITFLQVILYVKKLLNIVCLLIPIGLVVMVSLDMFKNVIGKVDDMNKNLKAAGKRILYAICIFLVPTIVNLIIDVVDDAFSDNKSYQVGNYHACFNVDEEVIADQIDINKKNCNKDDEWEWDEDANTCNKIPEEASSNFKNPETIVVKEKKYNDDGGSGSNSSSDGVADFVTYKQTDYGNSKCGRNIYKDGCGATALAMVVSTFGEKCDPKCVSDWLCSQSNGGFPLAQTYWYASGGGGVSKIENKFGVKNTQLFYSESGGFSSSKSEKILSAVKAGKVVVMLIPGHYIVVGPSSKCGDDKVYAANFYAKTGCYTMDGLKKATIAWGHNKKSTGWRGAWAFEKAS